MSFDLYIEHPRITGRFCSEREMRGAYGDPGYAWVILFPGSALVEKKQRRIPFVKRKRKPTPLLLELYRHGAQFMCCVAPPGVFCKWSDKGILLHELDILDDILRKKPRLVNNVVGVQGCVMSVRTMVEEFFDEDLIHASIG